MPADPTCLEMPDDLSAMSAEGLSDPSVIAAAERALQGARGAEYSASVARRSVEACRIEASSAEFNAGTARLAVSSADASADSAASCAAAARLHADRAEKALHDVRRIGWSVALVGVGMLLGLTLALALYVMRVWLTPPYAPTPPSADLYLRTPARHYVTGSENQRPADVPSAKTIWTRS